MICGGVLAIKFSFRAMFVVVIIGSLGSLVVSELGVLSNSSHLLYLGQVPQSFFMGALKLLVYEFVTEISYPVTPAITLGLLHMFAGLINLILTISCDTFGRDSLSFLNMIQFAFMGVLGLCLLAFMRIPF